MFHMSPSVRYTPQPIHDVRTRVRTLSVNTRFPLRMQVDGLGSPPRREVALVLLPNSTLGSLV